MKITNQTLDILSTKDGNLLSLFAGAILLIISIFTGYVLLSAPESKPPFVLVVTAVFALAGLAMLLFSASITMDIDKPSGQIIYKRKSLIKSSADAYNIADVLRVETRRAYGVQRSNANGVSSSRRTQTSQSIIVFKNGLELPIDSQKSYSNTSGNLLNTAVMMAGSGAESALANQIASFLSVPFQEV